MNILEKAIHIALEAHEGQVDKAGRPYILHPLRLMNRMESESHMMAAVLHDVIEDSDITVEVLMENGIPYEVIEIVEFLTKRDGESYEDFIKRVALNKKAVKIKIADIEDNMNLSRLSVITQKDFDRLIKYHNALKVLKSINY